MPITREEIKGIYAKPFLSTKSNIDYIGDVMEVVEDHIDFGDSYVNDIIDLPGDLAWLYAVIVVHGTICGDGFEDFFFGAEYQPFRDLTKLGLEKLSQLEVIKILDEVDELESVISSSSGLNDLSDKTNDILGRYFDASSLLENSIVRYLLKHKSKIIALGL